MTCAPARLFDNLIGAGEQRRRDFEAQRLGGSQVDHQLIFGRRLHGEVCGLLALENPPPAAAAAGS